MLNCSIPLLGAFEKQDLVFETSVCCWWFPKNRKCTSAWCLDHTPPTSYPTPWPHHPPTLLNRLQFCGVCNPICFTLNSGFAACTFGRSSFENQKKPDKALFGALGSFILFTFFFFVTCWEGFGGNGKRAKNVILCWWSPLAVSPFPPSFYPHLPSGWTTTSPWSKAGNR